MASHQLSTSTNFPRSCSSRFLASFLIVTSTLLCWSAGEWKFHKAKKIHVLPHLYILSSPFRFLAFCLFFSLFDRWWRDVGESGSLWTRFKLKIWTHHATDLQILASELLQVLSLQRLTSLQYLSLQCIRWELCPPLLRVIVENHSTIRKISLDVLLPYVPFSSINAL